MAFYSQQCVDCTEATKRCTGEYHGKDEEGKPFSGSMYTCDNLACRIHYEHRKIQRYMETTGERRTAADSTRFSPSGEEKDRNRYR